jgi:hypothetical protein
MAAVGQVVTVNTTATLIFQVVDEQTYAGLTSPAANIFKAGTPGDVLPILLVFPASTSIFLGGSGVTASSTGVGANINGVTSLSYNCVGGDSLYGIVATSTAAIQLLVLRQ